MDCIIVKWNKCVEEDEMGELSNLINIGKKVEEQLNQIGIITYEQLKETGSKEAWLKIKAIDASA